ncbi:MAG: TlpA disulfide reductase family protein [Acidobacteriota bacterium]
MKNTKDQKTLCTPARLAATIVVLSLFAAFGVSSCSSGDERRANPSAPSVATNPARPPVNPAAPPPRTAPRPRPLVVTLPPNVVDAELQAVSGAPIKLSKYKGKVLVVNLWATWCGPCRMEIPELVKLYKEFRGQGLEVVGLSTETPEESIDKVKKFMEDYDVGYRVGWATADVAITLMQGAESIPQSFVIGRDGRVIKRFIGFNQQATPLQIREAIQTALNEQAAD